MADDVDNSLLSRLQALRASSATPERPGPGTSVSVDIIERAKTPTREDALAARLKRLRDREGPSSSPSSVASPPANRNSLEQSHPHNRHASHQAPRQDLGDDDDDAAEALFRTDDDTLEELLGAHLDDQPPPSQVTSPRHPGRDEVRALLEELAAAIPKEGEAGGTATEVETALGKDEDADDSDGEQMGKETDEVIARFQDEAELDMALGQGQPQDAPQSRGANEDEAEADANIHAQQHPEDNPSSSPDLALPSLPSDLPSLPSATTLPPASTPGDDIAARMAALRAFSSSPPPSFPSVPTSRPSATVDPAATAGSRRLTSRTAYTDDDVDSWCTVCLADATLRCLGCDDDPYCARCWWEMHLGPSAGFGDGYHKAVQFTDSGDKEMQKTALRAS